MSSESLKSMIDGLKTTLTELQTSTPLKKWMETINDIIKNFATKKEVQAIPIIVDSIDDITEDMPDGLYWVRTDEGSSGTGSSSNGTATTAQAGTVKLATVEEVKVGTDDSKAITPAGVKSLMEVMFKDYAYFPSVPKADKTKITMPKGTHLILTDGSNFVLENDEEINIGENDTTNGNDRKGKDVYIYAGYEKNTKNKKFVTSMSSTETEYAAQLDNAILVGGFHCLCADVGTIQSHTLTGYKAGEILPNSIWTLRHRPVSDPEGMVWIPEIQKWVDIYLGSWDNEKLVSKYNGTIADGTSEPKFHGAKFAECYGLVKKRLATYDEFTVFAKGSNEGTNIQSNQDPSTTGGHSDSSSRRMISNYGVEDCCGALWQFSSTLFENTPSSTHSNSNTWLDGYTWSDNSVYSSTVDNTNNKMGSAYGFLRRAGLGGRWCDGTVCGSRCINCHVFSSRSSTDCAGRGVSESLYLTGLSS